MGARDVVTVYSFKVWDHTAREMKIQPLKSRKEWIDRIGGEIVEGTGQDNRDCFRSTD